MEKRKLHAWMVLVGNLGTVYSGCNGFEANRQYHHYIAASKLPTGRASGEPVLLFKNGEITKEYSPKEKP